MKTSRLVRNCGLIMGWAAACHAGDFAIRDGDTVVFLGDSITAARTYGKIIENYTLLRYPQRKATFINAGWGGDTAAGGLKRLRADVFDRGATLLTVAYGINDIGWGMKADAEHRKLYLDSVRGIVEQCKARGVRVFICSAAATGENPETAENGYLQKMCDEGLQISRSMGEGAIDVQRAMRECQRKIWKHNAGVKEAKDKETLHAADGIHLNEQGQLAMAFAILNGLGAPAEVSSVVIDAATSKLIEARGCQVTGVKATPERAEFVRLDDGLPITFGLAGLLSYRFIPIPDELDRYTLTVKGLREGRYEVRADDRLVGTYDARRLADGVNLGTATPDPWLPGGPWDAQCTVLRSLTDARTNNVVARLEAGLYLGKSSNLDALRKQADDLDAKIVDLQRLAAKPTPYHFVVRPKP